MACGTSRLVLTVGAWGSQMNKTLYSLLAKSAMRDYGDGFRALLAPRERNRATFEIQFGAHKVSAVGFPASLRTFDYEFERRNRAASFATAALVELMEGAVLPLVSKYYEPVYGDLGLHYPKRDQFFFKFDVREPARPRFRVMEDFAMQVRPPMPVFGRHLV